MIRELGLEDGKIWSLILQTEGNALIEVDLDHAAKWFTNDINRAELCIMLGDGVKFKRRLYNVIAFNSLLNLDLKNEGHLDEIRKIGRASCRERVC